MRSRKVVACFLILASFFVADVVSVAARQQPAQVSRDEGHGGPAAPKVHWSEVQIEFEGNRLFTGEQLLGLTRQCYEGYPKDDAIFNPNQLDYCLRKNVVGFMGRSGYLRARIGEVRVQELSPGVKVTVPVEDGELYRLGEIKIDGAEFFPAEKLRGLLPLKKGDIADREAILSWLSEHLNKDYENNGFIQFAYEVEPEFKVEPGAVEGIVDFLVTITEGKQFTLHKVGFTGNVSVTKDMLLNTMLIKEGEVFSAQKFRDSIKKINDLQLFNRVDADKDSEFRTDEETGDLEILIRVTERGQEQTRVNEGSQERSQTAPANPQESGGQVGKPRLIRRH